VAASLLPIAYIVLTGQHPVLLWRNVAVMLASGLIIGGALIRQWSGGSCWRALHNRPLRWLGGRSYSFYLFHVLVLRFIVVHIYRGIGPHAFFVYAALTLVFSLPVAALGYALVERPFLARRGRWRSGGTATGAESPLAAEEDVPAPVARLA
jgi:peptidoglycan/LPS O-acetylase OafA/YrhL